MSKNNSTGRERRSIRNLVQDPRVQYGYALYCFAFAVVAAVINHMFMGSAIRGLLRRTVPGTAYPL